SGRTGTSTGRAGRSALRGTACSPQRRASMIQSGGGAVSRTSRRTPGPSRSLGAGWARRTRPRAAAGSSFHRVIRYQAHRSEDQRERQRGCEEQDAEPPFRRRPRLLPLLLSARPPLLLAAHPLILARPRAGGLGAEPPSLAGGLGAEPPSLA